MGCVVVGYHWNRLNKPGLMAGQKHFSTEFDIHYGLESRELLLKDTTKKSGYTRKWGKKD